MRSIFTAKALAKQVNSYRCIYVQTDSWGVFPREREGNNYDLNFSLLEDGITSVGDSFRNARLQLLASRLPVKVENGKAELSHPKYFGKYDVKEAGAGDMTLEDFAAKQSLQQELLSNGSDIFVEDAGLGSFSACRVGARVVSHSSAVSLILRQLMLPLPPRALDHRARFTGWTSDERYQGVVTPVWQDSTEGEKGNYLLHDRPIEDAKGQRPIGAFIGGNNDRIAVQFVEHNGSIVGGNIVAGSLAPIRGVIAAMGHAANVLVNAEYPEGVAMTSACFVGKTGDSGLIVDASDEVLDAVAKKHTLYSAYNNIVIPTVGVSAMWNGVIDGSDAAASTTVCRAGEDRNAAVPQVVVEGASARSLDPVNMVKAPNQILFFEAGAKKSEISEKEAVERIVGASDDSKADVAARMVTGVKLYVVGSVEDAVSVL